jgi:hypothetical protein
MFYADGSPYFDANNLYIHVSLLTYGNCHSRVVITFFFLVIANEQQIGRSFDQDRQHGRTNIV